MHKYRDKANEARLKCVPQTKRDRQSGANQKRLTERVKEMDTMKQAGWQTEHGLEDMLRIPYSQKPAVIAATAVAHIHV